MSREEDQLLASRAWQNSLRKTQLQRRGCSVFSSLSSSCEDLGDGASTPRSSSAASDDAEEGGEWDVQHVERLLSNGDFYTGLWAGNRPHGTGKYLWTDGCMYEGEWHRGKTNGTGKFSWPSGATYEGEFRSGYLDGLGTFTSASGDTYRGCYSMNLKNGQGRRTYTNGDYYDGEWRNGVQDGHGRYVWKTGHVYTGSWRSGTIAGKGVLVWANGNSYEGEWSAGAPCGKGQFRWADGSVYVGVWSDNPDERKGFYFPAGAAGSDGGLQRDPQEELGPDLGECKVCPGEGVAILPSQKAVWRPTRSRKSVGETARPPRRSSHSSAKVYDGSEAEPAGDAGGLMARRSSAMSNGFCNGGNSMLTRVPREVKRQGETIRKGHKNYELMLNLQLGIRHSVGKHAAPNSPELKASAFDPKEKVWTKFPSEGSKHTPPHQSCEFRWKDYCPVVFRTLRKLFKVDPADYMLSICGDEALRELSSPGKSGSFFYLTHDNRYMIKTLKKAEVKVLLRMLPAYYNHVRAFENTLVTKFFGLHCVKLSGTKQKKVRFVIMGNLFCSGYAIHRRYDLKGSSLGRTTSKPESEIDETTTLKDLDLNFIFRLQKSWFQEFNRQVDRDCEFLELERIMDYSLLVGLHFRDVSFFKDPLLSEGSSDSTTSTTSDGTPRVSRSSTDHLVCDPQQWASIKLGVNMPARVEKLVRRSDVDAQSIGDPTGEMYEVILFFGIIDILQEYDISKKVEHVYKSMQYDPTSISAVDPKQYSRRFRDFICRVFAEDT